MLVLEWKGRAFIEKVNSRCFCWFPAAIFCPPVWRLHTKLYKGAWNISATNSETVGHKDLRFGQIVYILVFYNISFSWVLPLDGFRCIFLCRVYCVTVKTKNTITRASSPTKNKGKLFFVAKSSGPLLGRLPLKLSSEPAKNPENFLAQHHLKWTTVCSLSSIQHRDHHNEEKVEVDWARAKERPW